MNRDELLMKLPRFIGRCKKAGYPVTDYQLYPSSSDTGNTVYTLELNLGHWNPTIDISDQLSHILNLLNTSLSTADASHIVSIYLFDTDQNLRGILNID